MNNFCWTKISGSTWKQYWFLKKSSEWVCKKDRYKKHEILIVSGSISINFLDPNRQFDWLEILLVYDKSNKHTTDEQG